MDTMEHNSVIMKGFLEVLFQFLDIDENWAPVVPKPTFPLGVPVHKPAYFINEVMDRSEFQNALELVGTVLSAVSGYIDKPAMAGVGKIVDWITKDMDMPDGDKNKARLVAETIANPAELEGAIHSYIIAQVFGQDDLVTIVKELAEFLILDMGIYRQNYLPQFEDDNFKYLEQLEELDRIASRCQELSPSEKAQVEELTRVFLEDYLKGSEVFNRGIENLFELISAFATHGNYINTEGVLGLGEPMGDFLKRLRGEGTGGGDGQGNASIISAPRDPIFLDLNRNGKLDAENRAYFDLNGNQFKEYTNWMSDGDGMLVLDRNENGVIDNGTELFGDATPLGNGTFALTGFQALAELDSNGDGVIDELDEAFADLRVWIDVNSDGVSESGELKTLQELGIVAIHLTAQANGTVDENGNIIARVGTFEWEDGTLGVVGEMLLEADHMRNIPVEYLELPEDIAALPELMGGGLVHDLSQAMVRDESGRLKGLLEDFIVETDEEARNPILKELVFVWFGVENIDPNSRGAFIDARELAVLEQYSGRPFVGTTGSNPHQNAAPVLKETYEMLMGHFYRQLLRQTDYAEYFNAVENSDIDAAVEYVKASSLTGSFSNSSCDRSL